MYSFKVSAAAAASFGAALAISSPAGAATLTGGGLLIDTGSGYQMVSPPMEVQPGTSIIANPDGRGEILYADGCIQRVRPGEVILVTNASPCAAGNGTPSGTSNSGTSNYGLILGGGLVVGGIVVGAIALSSGGDDKPKSP